MNRKQILILCFVLVTVAACKKNDSTPTPPIITPTPPSPPSPPDNSINAVGVWSLVSSISQQINDSAPTTYTSTDYPCISDNKLYINSDSTFKRKYFGADTCYVLNTPSYSISIGTPGDSTIGTWKQSANTVFLNFRNTISSANLSTVNGVTQIIERDTVTALNMVVTDIYEK